MHAEALDKSLIDQMLGDPVHTLGVSVEVVAEVDSTNEELLRRAAAGDTTRSVLLAETQSAGRGRSGRRWVSPQSNNLYLSFAWHFPGGVQALAGLSLAVGVAVVNAVQSCSDVALQLKWPNDIVHAKGKVGGVLIETVSDRRGGCIAVVGVGLNVGMPNSAGAEIDQAWLDINRLAGTQCSRNVLAGATVARLADLLTGFSSEGFSAWRARWEALDILRGQRVVADGASVVEGVADGVADDGGLRVMTDAGLVVIHAGEARLRKNRGE